MKLKGFKIFSLVVAIAAVLCMLSSCFDFGTNKDDGTVKAFAPDKTVYIITSAQADSAELYARDSVRDTLSALGLTVKNSTDTKSDGYRIYVGNMLSSATSVARTKLSEAAIADDDYGFVLAVGDGSLAIIANSDVGYRLAGDYFAKTYSSEDTLVLDKNYSYVGKMTAEEYANILASVAWENRWDYTERVCGASVTSALKRLYNFYGDSVYKWIANLYDINGGGFYYANSARDYDGFLPDIESTTQALWLITASGLTAHLGNDLSVALPEKVVTETLNFVYSLYDDTDGYFYHEQWGKDIGSARKGRDLNSSIDVIRKLGGVVPENNALNRLEGGVSGAVSKVLNASSVRPVSFLSSESELLAWLNARGINSDSHGAGHTIESSASQIRAAGYSQFVLEWLDSKQLDNGLWEEVNPKNPYQALSGLLKIGSCYKTFGGQMKSCDKMIDTAISVILSDVDPAIVIYVYNPWGGLKYALQNMKSANNAAKADGKPLPYDYNEAYEKVLNTFSDMIDVTIDKLDLFQKADGSFSYYQGVSAAYTQGTHVSLGYAEGDVNGTSLGMTTMYTTLFDILGIPVVSLYNEDDYNEFINILNTLEPITKKDRPKFEAVDFDDGSIPVYVSTYATSQGSEKLVEDDGEGNMALHVISPGGIGDQVTFKADATTEGKVSFAFDFDMRIDSSTSYSHQISLLDSSGAIATMMTVHVNSNTITFADTTSNNYYTGAVQFSEASATVGEWFHVRMEYHVIESGEIKFVLYINENYAGESDNYFGKLTESGMQTSVLPKLNAERVQIYAMMGATVDFWIDNLDYEFYDYSTYGD